MLANDTRSFMITLFEAYISFNNNVKAMNFHFLPESYYLTVLKHKATALSL